MISDPAGLGLTPSGDADPLTSLSAGDAAWLRRGEKLGELLLTTPKYAAYGWSAALVLAGGSLIALALVGTPADHNQRQSINAQSLLSHDTDQVSYSFATQHRQE